MNNKRVLTLKRASEITKCFTSKINSISYEHYESFLFIEEIKKTLIKIEYFDCCLIYYLNYDIPNEVKIDIDKYFNGCFGF